MNIDDPEQRSRIARAQKAVHGIVAELHVCMSHVVSDREERDIEAAHEKAEALEELLGALMMGWS